MPNTQGAYGSDEIWKPVSYGDPRWGPQGGAFARRYQVSNLGRCRRLEAGQGIPVHASWGPEDLQVRLRGPSPLSDEPFSEDITVDLCLLVAHEFIGPQPEAGFSPRHINDDREDNRAVNLEYRRRSTPRKLCALDRRLLEALIAIENGVHFNLATQFIGEDGFAFDSWEFFAMVNDRAAGGVGHKPYLIRRRLEATGLTIEEYADRGWRRTLRSCEFLASYRGQTQRRIKAALEREAE